LFILLIHLSNLYNLNNIVQPVGGEVARWIVFGDERDICR